MKQLEFVAAIAALFVSPELRGRRRPTAGLASVP